VENAGRKRDQRGVAGERPVFPAADTLRDLSEKSRERME